MSGSNDSALRAQVVLRCLRRCGWSDERIDATVARDMHQRWQLVGAFTDSQREFYNTILVSTGVD